MAEDFADICDRLKATYLAKKSEYDSPDNPFHNFDACAQLCKPLLNPNIPDDKLPLAIAFILESKQIVGSIALLGNGKDNKAAMEDKLQDKAVYSMIETLLYRR